MRTLSTLILSLFVVCSWAQNPQEEIKENINRSGSNHYAYPTPTKALSPAPEGKAPFYISHYGRHGSRYLIGKDEYLFPLAFFEKADSAGQLTAKGKEVLQKIRMMASESDNRYGELTLLGAQQHRGIAHRMYEHFPEVFAGDVCVDAKSTVVIRCILSMENELLELTKLNPELKISHDASFHDMYYMNFRDEALTKDRYNDASKDYVKEWEKENLHPDGTLQALFTDLSHFQDDKEKMKVYKGLFDLATIVQNCEIRHEMTLYDIFSENDLYTLWQDENLWWFCNYGSNALNGGTQPYTQRNLLRKIISEADSCLVLSNPGATLRFGHDTMVMPLTCLLNLNGYGKTLHPSELLANNWVNYRIFPMACNIQFIFYRSNPQDKDIWVKVLLNEEEASLPITPVEGVYYRWNDVKTYYTALLDAYKGD